jgi:CubicO group peptidase (beta-lactamase class C family)
VLRSLGSKISADITDEFKFSYTDAYRNVQAVLVSVCGKPVLERYENSTASDFHNVASVTKSVISTLVGVALAEGSIKSLDQPLAQLLPQHLKDMTPPVAAITLRELLTMTAGLDEDRADGGTGPWIQSTNLVRGILREGVHQPPGGQFGYSTGTSHLLAAIVVRATGRPLLDYARDKLFDPLGIVTRPAAQPLLVPASMAGYEKAGFAWPVDHQGINFGGGFLKMRPRDMVKLGQLYLDVGRWNNTQIVPPAWVLGATTAHVSAPSGFGGSSYGYQWWVTTAGQDPAYAAVGAGGQLIEVVPNLKLVVVFSTKFNNSDAPATVKSDLFEDMVSRIIAPALTP